MRLSAAALFASFWVLALLSVAAPAEKKPAQQRLVAIQPFEGIPAAHVEEVKTALETYYKCTVKILPEVALPKDAFTKVKTPRYRADKLLDFLNKKLPKDCDHVLGLTASDISTTKYEDWETRKIKNPECAHKVGVAR